MPRVIETTVYQFDELSPKAKEKARDWFKGLEAQDCDMSSTLDDFKRVCDLFGISIKTRQQGFYRAGSHVLQYREEDNIYYSGFSSQGDGASFEGTYTYKPGFFQAVTEYAPQDGKLAGIAARLLVLQKANGYRLSARITVDSGHYVHSNMMSLELINGNEDAENSKPLPDAAEGDLLAIMRALADWLYRELETEYYTHFENEYVDDTIRANEYEFTENGERA